MPLELTQNVIEYLKEGNNKEDLIGWIWELISEEERESITQGAATYFTDPNSQNEEQ